MEIKMILNNKNIPILLLCILLILGAGQVLASQPDRPLVVVSPWGAKGMDPLVSGFIFTRMGCLETLVTTDGKGKGGLTPLLASKWSVSEDKLTWTFTVKDGVFFHDGTPLTGENTALALERIFANGKLFKGSPVESVRGSGQKVIIKTSTPFSALPAYLAHSSTAIMPPAAFADDGTVKKIIGTGFYRLADTDGKTVFNFTAFADYWGEKAKIEKARYLAVSDGETRALMAESGDADIALTLSATAARRLRDQANVQINSTAIPRVREITLNANLVFFDSAVERLALSMAIDRQGIAQAILKNPETAATQLMPAVSMWHNPGLTPLAHNPEKARQLLEKAGWTKNKNGIYAQDGQDFSFDLLTYSTRPMLPVVAEALQSQFAEIGVRMNIVVGKSSQIPARYKDGTLEAALVGRNFGLVPDSIGTIKSDFGPAGARGSWGSLGWKSGKLNGLIDQYLTTFEEKKAAVIRGKIAEILQKELPVIPVSWYDHHVAVSKKISGVQLDPYEIRPYTKGVSWVR